MPAEDPATVVDDPAEITLYVAGTKRSSEMIQRITQEASNLKDRVHLSVIDVLEDPARAERDTILTTPMMVRWSPSPVRRLTGDIAALSQLLPSSEDGSRLPPAEPLPPSRATDEASGSAVISRAAHELRNPLTVIQGFAVTLMEAISTDDKGSAIKCAEGVVRGATHLHSVIDSMLVARTVERGGVHVDLVDVDLGMLTQETLRDLAPLTARHQTVVDVVEDAVVSADVVQVRQIITNLVSNAVKFSPPGTKITIAVSMNAEGGCLTVQDEGPGIPPDQLDLVFEQYERLGRMEKGMGLGLFISKQFALAHGGRLSAFSDGRTGTRLELILPRASGDAPT